MPESLLLKSRLPESLLLKSRLPESLPTEEPLAGEPPTEEPLAGEPPTEEPLLELSAAQEWSLVQAPPVEEPSVKSSAAEKYPVQTSPASALLADVNLDENLKSLSTNKRKKKARRTKAHAAKSRRSQTRIAFSQPWRFKAGVHKALFFHHPTNSFPSSPRNAGEYLPGLRECRAS